MTVRRRHRKPDLLLVIAVVVAIGVLVTSGAYAAEPPAPQRPDVSYPDRTPAPPAAEAAEPGQEPVAFG
ncbi:MAG: hypothetical protein GWO02_16155, partial [Gammaproteobacteria bacterium]|nr:hypothetical protein [Gammaproteobacteria bacterium]